MSVDCVPACTGEVYRFEMNYDKSARDPHYPTMAPPSSYHYTHYEFHPRQHQQQHQPYYAEREHGAARPDRDVAPAGAVCLPVHGEFAVEAAVDEVTEPVPKKPKRLCRFPGCTRVIKSQGHCQRHGAKVKRCRIEGTLPSRPSVELPYPAT